MDENKYIEDYVAKMLHSLKTQGNLILGYDFDDTVFSAQSFSKEYVDKVQNLIKRAQKTGKFRFIVITCREGEQLISAEHYLFSHNLPYNAINQALPWSIPDDPRKIYCNLMLDDKAGLPTALKILELVLNEIECCIV